MFTGNVFFKIKFLDLCVFGDVYEYRTRPATGGEIKCLCQNVWYFCCIGNLIVPFRNWRGDINDICFLEGIGAKQVCIYLSCNTN